MSCKLVLCASLANSPIIRHHSTFTQAKNMISCGMKIAQYKAQTFLHGPTCDEVMKDVDLSGKTWLITGANSGIGLEMARCASARGAAVLAACRNTYAAGTLARFARLYDLNLASLRSVRKCYHEILSDQKKIDIVILNAGVFGLPWTLTEDMLETTFQVNYLSQYHLLMNIESILAPNARVVFVSSESHRYVNFSIRDLMIPCEETVSLPIHEYSSIRAYNISKLCGVLAARWLAWRWASDAAAAPGAAAPGAATAGAATVGRRVLCVHPGSFVRTRLCRNWRPFEALYTAMVPFSKTISQAASTPLYCATSAEVGREAACYYKDCAGCEESELAKDLHFAFRINDLTRDLLRGRDVLAIDDGNAADDISALQRVKDTVHHTLTPELSA